MERYSREPGNKISQYTESQGLPKGTPQESPRQQEKGQRMIKPGT